MTDAKWLITITTREGLALFTLLPTAATHEFELFAGKIMRQDTGNGHIFEDNRHNKCTRNMKTMRCTVS